MPTQDLVILFGPPAVGKMTVGQELARRTGLKLFHNHLSLELANQFFDWSTPPFRRIDRTIRFTVFREVAASDLPGLIFTCVWAIELPQDEAYVDEISAIFTARNARVHLVELFAPQSVRLQRNRTENRLAHKPSKRDLAFSERLLLADEANHRFSTRPGDLPRKDILRIDTTPLTASQTAQVIIRERGLVENESGYPNELG